MYFNWTRDIARHDQRQHFRSHTVSGVQRSGDARGDCLIGCRPCQSLVLSSGVWWYVLAKFVDTTCVFGDSGAAEKQLRASSGGMKSSGVWGGGAKVLICCRGVQKFWFAEIWAKSLKIRVKMAPNSLKFTNYK